MPLVCEGCVRGCESGDPSFERRVLRLEPLDLSLDRLDLVRERPLLRCCRLRRSRERGGDRERGDVLSADAAFTVFPPWALDAGPPHPAAGVRAGTDPAPTSCRRAFAGCLAHSDQLQIGQRFPRADTEANADAKERYPKPLTQRERRSKLE
jgi:hypothetical protein